MANFWRQGINGFKGLNYHENYIGHPGCTLDDDDKKAKFRFRLLLLTKPWQWFCKSRFFFVLFFGFLGFFG